MKGQNYYLLLGGNKGNEHIIFKDVIQRIEVMRIGTLVKSSSLYQSPAWGFESNDFINQAIHITSELNPENLLSSLLEIELEFGRTRQGNGYADRSIDIDILLIDNQIINTKTLSVPHPRMHLRKFTLLPLAELNSQLTHPELNTTIKELLINCPDKSEVKQLDMNS